MKKLFALFFLFVLLGCRKDPPIPLPDISNCNCFADSIKTAPLRKLLSFDSVPSNIDSTVYEYSYNQNHQQSLYIQKDYMNYFYDMSKKYLRVLNGHVLYNSRGQITDVIDFDSLNNNLVYRSVYEYNEQGAIIKQTEFSQDTLGRQKLIFINTFEYSQHCGVITRKLYNQLNQLDGWEIIEFKDGNINKVSTYSQDFGRIVQTDEFFYDHHPHYKLEARFDIFDYCRNNWTSKVTRSYWAPDYSTGSTEERKFEYNAEGYPSKMTYRIGGSESYRVYQYY